MKNYEFPKNILKKLLNHFSFDRYSGGRAVFKTVKPIVSKVIRPYCIFSQLEKGGKSETFFEAYDTEIIRREGDALYGPANMFRSGKTAPANGEIIGCFTLCQFTFANNIKLHELFPLPCIIPADDGGVKLGEICVELRSIADNFEQNCILNTVREKILALEILLILAKHAKLNIALLNGEALRGKSHSAFSRTLDHITTHYNKNLSISELAHMANFSTSRFHRIFKSSTGFSPMNYIIRIRLDRAQEFLLMSQKSIAEISREIGWDDPFYFSRIFTSKIGMSPKKYREHSNLAVFY
jgi:AraC-like DNA-binding protein